MATSDNLITQQELANRFNVSTVTIGNWEDKTFEDFVGPFPKGKMEGRSKLYNWKACLQWYVKYTASSQFKSLFTSGERDFVSMKEEGDARKSIANAELAELNLKAEQGKLVPVENIEKELVNFVLMLRQNLQTLVPRLTKILTLDEDKVDALSLEIDNILRELASLKVKHE